MHSKENNKKDDYLATYKLEEGLFVFEQQLPTRNSGPVTILPSNPVNFAPFSQSSLNLLSPFSLYPALPQNNGKASDISQQATLPTPELPSKTYSNITENFQRIVGFPDNNKRISKDTIGEIPVNNDAIRLNNTIITLSNRVIVGDNNNITGDNNIITGDNNNIMGDNNSITGNYNDITGDENNIRGDENNIRGDNNNIIGDGNSIQGDNNSNFSIMKSLDKETVSSDFKNLLKKAKDFIIGEEASEADRITDLLSSSPSSPLASPPYFSNKSNFYIG